MVDAGELSLEGEPDDAAAAAAAVAVSAAAGCNKVTTQ
jgi:hypothetical protein